MKTHSQSLCRGRDRVPCQSRRSSCRPINADTIERTFLDARHGHPDTYVIPFDPDDPPDPEDLPPALPIHYTLQDLLAHFIIPDVPDVVAMHTSQYQAHLDAIARIENLLS